MNVSDHTCLLGLSLYPLNLFLKKNYLVCLFFVSVPGPVAHLTVVESKETGTVAVSWDPPANEACIEEYRVTFEYLSACNETSKPLVFEIQNTDTAVNITGVPPGALYTLFVFAGNDLGESTTGYNGTTPLQGICIHPFKYIFVFCESCQSKNKRCKRYTVFVFSGHYLGESTTCIYRSE